MMRYHNEMKQLILGDAFDRYLSLAIKQRLSPYVTHSRNLVEVAKAFAERRDVYAVAAVRSWLDTLNEWCDTETAALQAIASAAQSAGKPVPPPPASRTGTIKLDGPAVPDAFEFPPLPNPFISCAEGYTESMQLISSCRASVTAGREHLSEYERYIVLYHSTFGEIDRLLGTAHTLGEDVMGFCSNGAGIDRDTTLIHGVPRLLSLQTQLKAWLNEWKNKTDFDPILRIGVNRLIDRTQAMMLTPSFVTRIESELAAANERQREILRKQASSEMASAQRLIASALSTAAAHATSAGSRVIDVLGVKLPNSVRIIPYEDLQLNKKLGAGSFGYVRFWCGGV